MKKILLLPLLLMNLSGPLSAQCVGALNLPTATDYVQFASPFYSYTNEITVEGWVYMDGSVNSTPWVGQATAGLDNMSTNVWHWHGASANQLAWEVNDNGTWRQALSSTMSNGWHHVATVADNASTRIYIDGVLDASGPAISGAMRSNSNSEIHVGHDVRFAAGTGGRDGSYKIGELRVWNVARTQSQISANMSSCLTGSETGLKLYNKFENGAGGSATSAVGPNGTLINMNTTTSWVTGSGSECCTPASALNFDGSGQVQLPAINLVNSSFTMETWAKRNSTGGSFNTLFGQGITSTDQGLHIGFRNDNTFTLAFYGDDLNTSTTYTDLNWHHWAVTFDAVTNEQKIYLDGALVASGISGADYSGSGNLFLGNTAWGGDNFNGNMDEVRIWNVARTQCEINTYMNCEIPSASMGLLASYHFNQGVDGGSNSTVTSLTDASGNANDGILANFSLAGATSNWIAPGAVANGYTTTTACTMASALNFGGSDDYVSLNPINITGNSARTVEFWIKTGNTGTFQNPFSSGNASPGGAFNIKVTPSGHLGFMGFGNDIYPSSGTYIADNTFHHVAITYNGSMAKAYVDGNHEWDFAVNLNTTGEDNYIGRSNHYGNEQYFGGTIDELRIWNVERSRCDIVSYKNCEIPSSATGLVANYHFNQGYDMKANPLITSLTDASGTATNGILSNFALTGSTSNWVAPGGVVSGYSTSIACPYAAALNFDGANDVVSLPNGLPSMADMTIEGWIYPESISNFNVILNNSNWYTGLVHFQLRPSGELGFAINGNNPPDQNTSMVFTPNQWYHIAAVYSSANKYLKFYVNGVLVDTYAYTTAIATAANVQFEIGGWDGQRFFDGTMDELRIWNTTRTECEINTYMNCEIPSSTANLVANYHFNQGLASFSNPTETTLADASGNGYNGTLNGFGLNGTTSNWVAPGGVVSGYTTTLAPPTVTVNSGTICAGQSFTMVPGGALTYTFSNGTDVVMPTSDATYTVTGANAIGCENTAISSVTVNALPTVTINSGAICAGQSFTMVPGGADTYTFSGGSDVVTPGTDATYTITGVDASGCENMAISYVTVNALPTVTVNSGTVCAGQAFTMTPGGALSYTFSNGSNVYIPTVGASYSVTSHGITGEDANGCVSYASSYITAFDPPVISAVTSNTLLCTGETATLSVTGAISYTWSTTENATDIVVAPTTQTTFTVEGTDANGCSNTTTITQDVSLCTGIVTLSGVEAQTISVYPNPSNGVFYLELRTDCKVTVMNALGQTIVHEEMPAGKHELDIHNKADGVYFVKVLQDHNQKVIRIIKE